ncbi:MAG: hypothetical protein COB02_11435 [Candidatus Cloacimonadota bacterium]|nr:MAG: hypothetical protein COB02_11435 [Candidatus Cloacimonadota bacterium]
MFNNQFKLSEFLLNTEEILLEILSKENKLDESLTSDISSLMFLYHQIRELLSFTSEYDSLHNILRLVYNSLDRFTMMDKKLSNQERNSFIETLKNLYKGLEFLIEKREYFEFCSFHQDQPFRKIEEIYDLSFLFIEELLELEDYKDFIVEANHLFESLNESLENEFDLSFIFRVVHTIKGSSSFLEGLTNTINHYCHEFESYLTFVIHKNQVINKDLERIKRLLLILEIILNNLMLRLNKQDKFNESIDFVKVLNGLQKLIQAEDIYPDDLYQLELLDISLDSSIRVSALYIDQLAEGMESFYLKLNYFKKKVSSDLYLSEEFKKLENNFYQLQNNVLSLRLFPIEAIFKKFARQVEALSRTLNKAVKFQLLGLETKIDRNLADVIISPLTHIVRNAISHGIEDSDERVFIGKDAEGTIGLLAKSVGKNVVIEISDDGQGINLEKVRAQAINKGLIAKEAQLSEQETYNLLFQAGFSTSEKISELAGRGVGLDVVKVAIENIGGRVELSSELGKGTLFSLILPLTISTIDCLLFEVKNFIFTIPISNILTIYDNEQYQDKVISDNTFLYRSNKIKLIDLSDLLFSKPTNKIESNVLVLKAEKGLQIAIIISKIIAKDNLLLRPINHPLLKNTQISSSVSILKDGRIVSILDVNAIDRFSNLKVRDNL